MAAELDPTASAEADALDWQDFLYRYFPHYITAPFGDRHVRFWEWISTLTPGRRPRPRVEVWPRGGGKSATIELGCAFLGARSKPIRNYVLYVSETQAQADKHVQSIAGMLEHVGVGRAVNQYGSSKGWRHQEIRAANGFNVTAFGLDAGMRGARLDQYRPDVIVFDDIDGRHDTEATIQKKIDIITETILPAGSVDSAVIVIQNKIHKDSIVSRLVDGRADFLHDREPAVVEPAIEELEYIRVRQEDGTRKFIIVSGSPTWQGQDLETCQRQLNDWGENAFRREAQQEVELVEGAPLHREWFGDVIPGEHYVAILQSWDTAFKKQPKPTEKRKPPDWSVCLTIGVSLTGFDILDMWRDRVEFPDLERAAIDQATWAMHRFPDISLRVLIEDQASGRSLIQQLRRITKLNVIPLESGNTPDVKMQRVNEITPVAEARRINVPVDADWRETFFAEVTNFPDTTHDDIVDSLTHGIRYGAGIEAGVGPVSVSDYRSARRSERTQGRRRSRKET